MKIRIVRKVTGKNSYGDTETINLEMPDMKLRPQLARMIIRQYWGSAAIGMVLTDEGCGYQIYPHSARKIKVNGTKI